MKTILLIDDDEVCREPAAELLRQNEWKVLEAGDGATGLELAVKHRPDVILCDLLMPRVNGYQVCRAVRDHMELRHTKVIVVTGRDYSSDRKSAEEAGAHGYIVKPLSVTKLMEVLESITPIHSIAGTGLGGSELPEPPEEGTRIRFWGVRGSIPSPGSGTVFFGGNTSCVEVRTGGQTIVLDAGSGIRPLGNTLIQESKGRPIEVTILITHTHWDHIQGFPFFVPAYDARNKVRILGYEGAKDGLRATLAGQMESPYFPVAMDEMPSNLGIQELKDMSFTLGAVKIEACFTNHPGVCVAYKLTTPDGSVVYMPDNETKRGVTTDAKGVLIPDPTEANIAEFIRDVDVLIMDCQYTAEEYQTHVGWGHGSIDEVVKLAMVTGVKRLYTFHHDPSHDDRFISAMMIHGRNIAMAAKSPMVVEAAREGMEVVLRGESVTAQ